MKLRTHSFSDRRGATVVETAFVLLIALTLTLAIYDYGRYFMMSQLVNNAAREGARQAVANTNTQNTAMIQNTVVQYLANQNFKDSSGNAFSASDVVVLQVNPADGRGNVTRQQLVRRAFRVGHHGPGQCQVYFPFPEIWVSAMDRKASRHRRDVE